MDRKGTPQNSMLKGFFGGSQPDEYTSTNTPKSLFNTTNTADLRLRSLAHELFLLAHELFRVLKNKFMA